MPDLSISPFYLGRLIIMARGVQGREGEVVPDDGSNPTDDDVTTALQSGRDDLSDRELRSELAGLNDAQKAELVALLWTGRGDAEVEEWEATLDLARERADGPTETYLLGQPLVAEYWAEGADRLGIEIPIATADEVRSGAGL